MKYLKLNPIQLTALLLSLAVLSYVVYQRFFSDMSPNLASNVSCKSCGSGQGSVFNVEVGTPNNEVSSSYCNKAYLESIKTDHTKLKEYAVKVGMMVNDSEGTRDLHNRINGYCTAQGQFTDYSHIGISNNNFTRG